MRLTNDVKEHILDEATKQALNDRVEKLVRAYHALAEEVRMYGYKEYSYDTIESLPKQFLHTADAVSAQIGGEHVRLQYWRRHDWGYKWWPELEGTVHLDRPTSKDLVVVHATNDIANMWRHIDGEMKDIGKAYVELRASLRGLMKSAGTVEKLVKAWPEVNSMLPAGWNEDLLPATVEDVQAAMKRAGGNA